MKYEDFENKIDSTFKVKIKDGEFSLKLTQVEKLPPPFPEDYKGPRPDSYVKSPFRLTFCGPSTGVLPTQAIPMEDEQGNSYEIFLSAFLQNSDGIFYEAIFN